MTKLTLATFLSIIVLGAVVAGSQPAEARGWKHHLRDYWAGQGLFANPTYVGGSYVAPAYSYAPAYAPNPVQQFYSNPGYDYYPAYQNNPYGNGYYGYGQGCR